MVSKYLLCDVMYLWLYSSVSQRITPHYLPKCAMFHCDNDGSLWVNAVWRNTHGRLICFVMCVPLCSAHLFELASSRESMCLSLMPVSEVNLTIPKWVTSLKTLFFKSREERDWNEKVAHHMVPYSNQTCSVIITLWIGTWGNV